MRESNKTTSSASFKPVNVKEMLSKKLLKIFLTIAIKATTTKNFHCKREK